MKKIILMLLLIVSYLSASVNTRLVQISNIYDSPSAGKGTLVIDVEAISDAGVLNINGFQDAFALDANFQAQNPVVTFSQELFPSSGYNTTEDYTSSGSKAGRVRYIYSYDSGTRGVIGTDWTKVVRISIEYDMIGETGSISWTDLKPDFFVTSENNEPDGIQGTEEPIPAELSSVPLPVELQSFKATNQKGSSVELEWATATEVNNYGFEVERRVLNSTDADNELNSTWEKVAFVEGAGNSNATKVYTYVDKNPVGGTKFAYRLKQLDVDGTFEYSDEIEVKVLPSKYELYQNYPNPFNPTTKIKFSLPENAKVKISVYDILGRELTTLINKNIEAGYHSINFDATQFTSGVYLYTIETSKFTQVKKMLLIK